MAANDLPIARANTWHLSNRSSLAGAAVNKIAFYPGGEVKRLAFDCEALAGAGDYVASLGTAAVTPTGDVTVTSVGGRDYLAVIQLGADGGGTEGQEYQITVDVTLQSGDVIHAVGFAECMTVPDDHSYSPPFA